MQESKFIKPFNELEDLEIIRQGKMKMGLDIGAPLFDNHIRWKDGQFNMINGHDNVGKTDVLIWYFVCMARIHKKKFCIYSSENTIKSQVNKIFNFWSGRRLDKHFLYDKVSFDHLLNEISDYFKFIPTNKRYSAYDIIELGKQAEVDGLLIDPFNSLMTETANKHQEDYDICANLRIFAETTQTTVFVNSHLHSNAARNVYGDKHEHAGNLRPPEKADTEGGQKFANRADDFWTIHRMTQHKELWSQTELHVRKVKETITGGSMTPREEPIKMKWHDYSQYFIGGVNPLKDYYDTKPKDELDEAVKELEFERDSKQSRVSMMNKMSYGTPLDAKKPEIEEEEQELPF